jgi:hypothetical protein
MKSKLLGVNANSNDEQQHANKEMNGEMGQKRTGANSTSNDCSGRAGTSNDDGSSIHTTTKTTTTDYQQLQDERTGDDLDPIEQWRKQQDYLQKKQQEPQHIIKEVCIFLKNRSWKKKLMTFDTYYIGYIYITKWSFTIFLYYIFGMDDISSFIG